jgi:ion channel-forming bestrophin family protein
MTFAQALVALLRPGVDDKKIMRCLPSADWAKLSDVRNPPVQLTRLMGEELVRLRDSQRLTDIPFQMLDHTVCEMVSVLTACERIRGTPVPFGYTLLLHRTAYLFCFLLPFGFVTALGWATPFATALVAYTFFGLDSLGDELEEPFGVRENDLPIGALADGIEISLREALGETELPPLPAPRNYLLM